MPHTPTTIVDVARKLKLANTTVSEILRGKPGYNENTRRRVLDAASRLGYRPNYLSKALLGSKSMTIGVLSGVTETPVAATMVRPIELASRRRGYLCYLLDWGAEDEDQLVGHVQNLLDRRVDGLIAHQVIELPPKVERLLSETNVPVVRMGRSGVSARHMVRLDLERAVGELAGHLAALGHREAALVTSQFIQLHPNLKLTPYHHAFAAAGIRLDTSERWMVEPGQDYHYGCLALMRRNIATGNLPSVILFNSDMYAQEGLAALHDAGLRVPDDVSIVGFNDDHAATVTRPALTTIRQPRNVGAVAFDMLLALMEASAAAVENEVAYCELIVRDSTGPAHNPTAKGV